jgi:hypothetical protein
MSTAPSADRAALIELEGVVRTYATGNITFTALDHVDLSIGAAASWSACGAAGRLQAEGLAAGLPVGGVRTNAEIRAGVDDLMALVTATLLVVGRVLG